MKQKENDKSGIKFLISLITLIILYYIRDLLK
ncbi:putative membrane protein [Anoxybacillus sp. B7M1]|jgi:hypothetical protein|nr:putative membrane protein [Anoxybacillus sp. B2M1]ANB65262.1 putative membrane protein [Anoxybacillus sp. B7M1]MBB3854327.1 hypothetical protein [Parageobacillus caldoxylosilyticus]MBB3907335.1 hypothetical protein [Anoxybacillus rupiensis]